MLTRLLASVAIVSLLVAVAVSVLWWRADHGRADTFHLGASTATQTNFYTRPGGVDVEVRQTADGGAINGQTRPYRFSQILGGCFVAPGLWLAVVVRRKLLPRRPDLQLPTSVPGRARRGL